MFRRRIALTALWAGGTFALAMALGIPATSNAVDDSNTPGLVATILTPELTLNGVELTVTQDSAATQPSQTAGGGQLEFTVWAKNKTASAASGNFKIQLTSVSPGNSRSRTLPMPTEFWADSGSFGLQAGESKTFTFTPPPLLPNRVFTLLLNSPDNHVAMLSMVQNIPGPIGPNP